MSSPKPTRQQADLADVLEMVLDKGIVINADIAITVGETEMIGIELRAAIASFETAAQYGLAFPSGTDMRRVEQASGRAPLDADDEPIDLGIDASSGGADGSSGSATPPRERPDPQTPVEGDLLGDEEAADGDEDQAEAGERDGAGGEGSDDDQADGSEAG